MATVEILEREVFLLQRQRLGLSLEDLARKTRIALWKLEFYSCGRLDSKKAFSDTEKKKISVILNTPVESLFDNYY